MPRSTYGEGSIWFNAKRGLWFGQVYFGPGDRPMVSARSKPDMLEKMRKLHDRKPSRDSGLTTGEWLEHWIEKILPRRVEESTLDDYRRWARVYVKPYVGEILLDDLEVDDVEEMMHELETKGLAPRTVRQARNLLRRGLAAAVKRGKIPSNCAEHADAPRIRGAKTSDRLSATDARAVLKILFDDRLYALAVMALWLGIRPGELFALKWSQVDLRRKVVHIESTLKRRKGGEWYIKSTKTDAGERPGLPLPAQVVKALRQHQRIQKVEVHGVDHGFVFTDPHGEPLSGRDVLDWWHDATIRAGVGRRRFYCTRHTAATLMLQAGVPLEVVSKILGHSRHAITMDYYAEVGDQSQRDAVDRMDAVLGL